MTPFTRLTVLAIVACAHAQYQDERAPRYIASEPKAAPPPPVAILKQINRHSDDGSYTYGYEAADGSFKIETKSPTGEVKGKYGYKDDTGKVRVIEYGANKYGFQPAGEGITVAPPTLVDETREERQRQEKQQPDSRRNQYQAIDYDYNDEPAPSPPRPAPRPTQQYRPKPAPQQQYRPEPAPQQQYRSQPAPQQQYRPQPAPRPQDSTTQVHFPSPAPTLHYRPAQQSPTPPKPAFFAGAAPVPAEDNFFNPEPQQQRRQFQNKQQNFRPSPQFQEYDSFTNQQFSGQNNFAPPTPQKKNQPYSMLDELLKEYALPSSNAGVLHDITFGSY